MTDLVYRRGVPDLSDFGGTASLRGDMIVDTVTGIPYIANEGAVVPVGGGGEAISVKNYGAKGDGVHDDWAAITAAALVAATLGYILFFPKGTYLTSQTISLPSNLIVDGLRRLSIIKASFPTHIFSAAGTVGIQVGRVSFVGQNSAGGAETNSGIVFSAGSSDGLVENCYFSGMSGWPIYVDNSNTITIRRNSITSLGTPISDSAHICLYNNAERCLVDGNTLIDGGTGTWQGLIMQVGAKRNRIVNNLITGFACYGIVDYQPVAQQTDNIITGNTIRDIDGGPALLSGNSGAGIYLNDCGGDVVSSNNLYNTNINTTTESLAPGAIGVAGGFSENNIVGNVIDSPVWYGIMAAGTTAPVNIVGNVIKESKKGAIYAKSASNVNINGNRITALTATPYTVSAISANTAGGGPFTNISIVGNNILGGGGAVIYVDFTNKVVISGNNTSLCKSIPCKVQNGDKVTISGNYLDASVATAFYALGIDTVTNCSVTGNTFLSTDNINGHVSIAGVSSGIMDESNVLVGGTVNNINNSSAGFMVVARGTAIPIAMNHQVGDRVKTTTPAAATTPGWVCTAAGNPGTWKLEAALSA